MSSYCITDLSIGIPPFLESEHKVFYKDLTEQVIIELSKRIEVDPRSARLILQSFGITGDIMAQHSIENVADVFKFFPNTPVKLLKDVFEALQLYDLVDLLEEPTNPLASGSLRLPVSLDEIRKLSNKAGRPISYHSRAAVLILTDDTHKNNLVKEIEKWFKDLNFNSKVTVIQRSSLKIRMQTSKHKLLLLNTQEEIRRINEQLKTANVREATTALKSELQSKMETLEPAKKALKVLREKDENVLGAALMVIDEWIQCEGWCKLRNTFVGSEVLYILLNTSNVCKHVGVVVSAAD